MKGYGECSIVGSAAHIMGNVGPQDIDKSRGCAEDRIQKARVEFATLPAAKPAAAIALKEYYAAWIAAMQSLPSRLAQSRSGAATASAATKQRLDELWARFEIEASLP